MKKIYIWGVGPARALIVNALDLKHCQIKGYIDNDSAKIGTTLDGLHVFSINEIDDYDYIITSVRAYKAVVHQFCELGYAKEKLICFFSTEDWKRFSGNIFIKKDYWKTVLLEERISILELRLRNAKYEIMDRHGDIIFPKIGESCEAINKIVNEGYSLIRFGDGEFEIMAEKNRAPFQQYNNILSVKMKQIVKANDKKLLICIADNYGCLDKYTDEIADDIRAYMSEEVRRFHLSVIDISKKYYDAYLFKPYILHRDKGGTEMRVQNIKRIWEKKDIIIIEGEKTRTGVNNDLLCNANSIQRLLAPTQNAFDKYDEILNTAMKFPKDKLILMVLGPAGKVMAYDLFKAGYQVVDIGQIDMDYDWYKSGLDYKTNNKFKYVSQIADKEILDIDSPEYYQQIIAKIL